MKQPDPRPGKWQLFRIWTSIGLQSFGGGSSTIFQIQQEFIEKRGWMTMEDFSLFWNLCLFTPGINIIALTVLIGRKLGGISGIVVSLIGLLLPSATITCLLAAGFKLIENRPDVQAILRGVIPATAGVMFVVATRFAHPLLTQARKEGWARSVASAIIVLACTTALIVLKLSVILVLICAATTGAIIFTSWRTPHYALTESTAPPTPPTLQEHSDEAAASHTADSRGEQH
ncbi:MAG TPA: chromate transporter [Ktedonosporobacter sp.]|jgi:chromate transporter|nr:chromate transporter [Ktedonosporobacter sp.]